MTSKLTDTKSDGGQSISRALYLLSIVAEHGERGARLSVVSTASKLHIATARRMLQALVNEGFLSFNSETKLYTIGPAIFSYAVQGNPWFARREIFMPVLDRVAQETRDTVLFSIRSGLESVCLARCEGEFPVRVMSLQAGTRRPLGVGSGSLAILAYISPDERELIIGRNAALFAAFKLSKADVEKMVAEAQVTGFAFNPARIIDDVYGLGVPILVNDEAVASISVTAISTRMPKERRAEIVRTICHELAPIKGVRVPDALLRVGS